MPREVAAKAQVQRGYWYEHNTCKVAQKNRQLSLTRTLLHRVTCSLSRVEPAQGTENFFGRKRSGVRKHADRIQDGIRNGWGSARD